jgi:short-subunit dehydrogenase involved in D-alanine esterification of teichoic acids
MQLEGLTFLLDGTAHGVGAGLSGSVRLWYQIYVGVKAAVHSFNVMLTSER